ncbi:flagellar basal body rod protein FlgB [Nocardioides pantholopis]|uniref:flagellar basal body rod protein FlgB n=1 Tax=Nocardioides pantholopis TaxID=2483798 RepID=UPI001F156301|nr:flagellar basal body protein [Nocardioides pantholopis]
MPISPVGHDAVASVLATTLDGLALRRDVIADNIANVDTPGFRATSVDFESALERAIDRGERPSLEVSTQATDTPVGANGNNVDLRHESMAAMQTQYQYQIMTRAAADRHQLVKIAAEAR